LRQYVKAIQGMALFFSEDTGVYDSPMAWFKANVALPGEDTTGIATFVDEAAQSDENGARTNETTQEGQIQPREETGASEAEKVPFQKVEANGKDILDDFDPNAPDNAFIKSRNGTLSHGHITEETAAQIGSKPGEIRVYNDLKKKIDNVKDKESISRSEQLKRLGYDNVIDFIDDTLANWTNIYKGTGTSFLLVKKENENHLIAVQLEEKNGYYKVNTIMKTRDGYLKNKKLLAERAPSNHSQEGTSNAVSSTSNDIIISQNTDNSKTPLQTSGRKDVHAVMRDLYEKAKEEHRAKVKHDESIKKSDEVIQKEMTEFQEKYKEFEERRKDKINELAKIAESNPDAIYIKEADKANVTLEDLKAGKYKGTKNAKGKVKEDAVALLENLARWGENKEIDDYLNEGEPKRAPEYTGEKQADYYSVKNPMNDILAQGFLGKKYGDPNLPDLEVSGEDLKTPDMRADVSINPEPALKEMQNILKADGWTRYHQSGKRVASSSAYFEKDGQTIRLSNHELPQTPEREYNTENGLRKGWTFEFVPTTRDLLELYYAKDKAEFKDTFYRLAGLDEDLTQYQTQYKDDGAKVRGAMETLRDGRRIIRLFEAANASTFIHEAGHLFLSQLEDHADNEKIGKLLQQTRGWQESEFDRLYRVKERDDGKYIVTDKKGLTIYDYLGEGFNSAEEAKSYVKSELFARGFEKYCEQGKAPKSFLRKTFNLFKKWLSRIRSVIEDDVKISDDIRSVYQNIFAPDALEFYTDESAAEAKTEFAKVKKALVDEKARKRQEAVLKAIDSANEPVAQPFKPVGKIAEASKGLGAWWRWMLKPIDTRAQDLNVRLWTRLMRYEYNLGVNENRYVEQAEPFFRMWQKMEVADQMTLDLILKNQAVNGDEADAEVTKRRNAILDKYDGREAYEKVVALLEKLRADGIAAGMEIGKLTDYFPRKVKYYDELL